MATPGHEREDAAPRPEPSSQETNVPAAPSPRPDHHHAAERPQPSASPPPGTTGPPVRVEILGPPRPPGAAGGVRELFEGLVPGEVIEAYDRLLARGGCAKEEAEAVVGGAAVVLALT